MGEHLLTCSNEKWSSATCASTKLRKNHFFQFKSAVLVQHGGHHLDHIVVDVAGGTHITDDGVVASLTRNTFVFGVVSDVFVLRVCVFDGHNSVFILHLPMLE